MSTRGEEDREVVLGSKEKISMTAGEKPPRLSFPSTTRLTFSGRRIHDPHATVASISAPAKFTGERLRRDLSEIDGGRQTVATEE